MSQVVDLLDHKNWEGVSEDAQTDFLRLGEEMTKETLSLAHAADLRATTIMGIFGAIGVALFAAVATLIGGSHPSLPSEIAGAITAFGLFIAVGFCASAAWPTNFFVSGYEPRNLLDSSAANDRFRTRVLIAVVQDRIDFNRRAIDRAARLLMIALYVAGLSVILGVAAFLVLWGLMGDRPDEKALLCGG